MPRFDGAPLDADIIESLEAIDATLAGEAVDPRHAELAELALLLRAERPQPGLAFASELDQRVREHFVARPAGPPRRPRRFWLLAPATGLAASVVIAIVIVVSQGSTPSRQPPFAQAVASSSPAHAAAGSATTRAAAPAGHGVNSAALSSGELTVKQAPGVPYASQQGLAASSAGGPILGPIANGRRIIQGAQLMLTTSPSRVDTVAQEVFQVAGREKAIVQNSSVTATRGPGGYAQFQLSIPSASLAQAMAALSTLPYARVSSRTDTTQDVNGRYVNDVRALTDARVLRTALLKQLANAGTQSEIVSLTARIHDADASISSDEATLRDLNHQIGFSQVTVTINAGAIPLPVKHSSGFTLGKASHDAGRVLTVAAGVALIGAAALVPFGLLVALAWWVRVLVIRRRREQALDLA